MQRHHASTTSSNQMPSFFLAYHDCTLHTVHVPWVLNMAADAISRNRTHTPPNSSQCLAAARPSSSSPMEAASSHSIKLDVCKLESIADNICEASLVASSNRTYKSAQQMCMDICVAYGREPMPALEQLLILFIAELSMRVCHSIARTYLAAIWHMHISKGHAGTHLRNAQD